MQRGRRRKRRRREKRTRWRGGRQISESAGNHGARVMNRVSGSSRENWGERGGGVFCI
jgi:hypothetical protein